MVLAKRKRSSDAVSDAGTSHTEQTEASTPREPVDEKSRLLTDRRERHVAAKLKLEQQVTQAREQKQHIAVQLEQLEGCEGSKDGLGTSDLRRQLEEYEQQEQQAVGELAQLEEQFEAAVAHILGIAAEQQPSQLAEAVQEQQQLQQVQAEQLAMEQQLGRADFAVTDKTKHQAKRARLERISHVWDWLQDSSSAGNGDAAGQQRQEQQLEQEVVQHNQNAVQLAREPQGVQQQQQPLPVPLLLAGCQDDMQHDRQQQAALVHGLLEHSTNGVDAAVDAIDSNGQQGQQRARASTHLVATPPSTPAAQAEVGSTGAASPEGAVTAAESAATLQQQLSSAREQQAVETSLPVID